MSRWGKPRKNKKFIDPRYFMDEKMEKLDESRWQDNIDSYERERAVRAKPVYADDFLAYIDGYQFSDERYREALKEVIADIEAQPETPRSYTGEVAIIEERALMKAIENHRFGRGFNPDAAKFHGDNQLISIASSMWNFLMKRDPRVLKYIKDRGPEGLGEGQIPDHSAIDEEMERVDELPCGARVKYRDNTKLIGTVLKLQSEEPYIASPGKFNKLYRVLWDWTDAYKHARGSDSPRGPSKGSGVATTTDERLLIPTGEHVPCPGEDA